MDVNKLRMLTLAAAGAAALTVATDAAACEACGTAEDGTETCWSGMMYGGDYCYGGFGEPCMEEGYCDDTDWRDCDFDYCGQDDWDCWAWGDCGWSW